MVYRQQSMPRSYVKKSPTWAIRSAAAKAVSVPSPFSVGAPEVPRWSEPQHTEVVASFEGTPFSAIANHGGSATSLRDNWAPAIEQTNAFPYLSAGLMPFAVNNGYYNMSVPINLATLAYFNIPLVRNTVNLLQDFSISPLRIKSANQTVKTFVSKWFESIKLNDFMSQFFLEYYRSGNIWIYKFDGKIDDDKFRKLKTNTALASARSQEIPIRYIILDPKQVYLQVGPTYNRTYSRMLSTFEIERLRNPQTPEDKQMLKSFPPDIQRQITNYAAKPWIYAPLDTARLYYCFYRKMDYEPLAVPMIFPLLNQLEYKLMLQKMDMSLVKTMEQVFMLVTAGDRKDQYNPGVNPKALANLQAIFQNQAIGRVLVADYTTKAEWKIPDLKGLLGKDKYEQVDKDIQEGLGYAFFGEDKFANATVKAKLFVESLREGRRIFLENFLMPEVKKLCESMGFKNVPTVEFEKIDVSDKTALQRVYAQMAQLGLLTPDELNDALDTGVLPTQIESTTNQTAFKAARDKGLYQPLLGKPEGDDNGRPAGTGGTKMPGRKTGTLKGNYQFSIASIIDNVGVMAKVQQEVENAYKKTYKLKELSDAQAFVARTVAKSIVINEPPEKWLTSVKAYIKDPKNIPDDISSAIDNISIEFETDGWTAVALYKARVESKVEEES